jgi:hypothetical protein
LQHQSQLADVVVGNPPNQTVPCEELFNGELSLLLNALAQQFLKEQDPLQLPPRHGRQEQDWRDHQLPELPDEHGL